MGIHVLGRNWGGGRWISGAHARLGIRPRTIGYQPEARPTCAAFIKIAASDLFGLAHLTNSVGRVVGSFRLPSVTSTQNLLQTGLHGRALGAIPVRPSLGADWARLFVHLNRCEGVHRATESAVLLFCALARSLMGHLPWRGADGRKRGPVRDCAPPFAHTPLALGRSMVCRSGQD